MLQVINANLNSIAIMLLGLGLIMSSIRASRMKKEIDYLRRITAIIVALSNIDKDAVAALDKDMDKLDG